MIKSDRVQAPGGNLAYIRAHSQTLVFKKKKGGQKEKAVKKIGAKKANKIAVGTQMCAEAQAMANHILIKSDPIFGPDGQKGPWKILSVSETKFGPPELVYGMKFVKLIVSYRQHFLWLFLVNFRSKQFPIMSFN